MGTQENIEEQLDNLNNTDGVRGSLVVRQDGLLIASKLNNDDINEDQVGAMTASTLGSGETASDSLQLGDVKGITVETQDGKIISMSVGSEGILTILTSAGTSIADINDSIREAGVAIADEL